MKDFLNEDRFFARNEDDIEWLSYNPDSTNEQGQLVEIIIDKQMFEEVMKLWIERECGAISFEENIWYWDEFLSYCNVYIYDVGEDITMEEVEEDMRRDCLSVGQTPYTLRQLAEYFCFV